MSEKEGKVDFLLGWPYSGMEISWREIKLCNFGCLVDEGV